MFPVAAALQVIEMLGDRPKAWKATVARQILVLLNEPADDPNPHPPGPNGGGHGGDGAGVDGVSATGAGVAQPPKAEAAHSGEPETGAGKTPPRAFSGAGAAAAVDPAVDPAPAHTDTDTPNAPDTLGPERPCWIEPEGGWQQRWGGDRRGQVPKHLREPSPSRKALEAARRGLSLSEIMRVCGVSKTMASVAGFVAKHGTPAEIFMIEMDKASCSTTAKKIRDRQERERVATVLKAIQDNPGITSHDVFWETGVAVAVLYVLKKSGLVLHRAGGWHLTERGREWLVKNCPPTPTAAKAEEPAS